MFYVCKKFSVVCRKGSKATGGDESPPLSEQASKSRFARINQGKKGAGINSLFEKSSFASFYIREMLEIRFHSNRNPKQNLPIGWFFSCAETVSSRELKRCDFYYILISFNSECKPIPWDIHCCHGNAIVEKCLV